MYALEPVLKLYCGGHLTQFRCSRTLTYAALAVLENYAICLAAATLKRALQEIHDNSGELPLRRNQI